MKAKKSKNASLEGKRFLFLQIGLVVAASITLMAFEWVSLDTKPMYLGMDEHKSKFQIVPEFVPMEVEKQKVVDDKELEKPKDNTSTSNDDPQMDTKVSTETEEAKKGEKVDKGFSFIDPNKKFGDINLGTKKPEVDLTVSTYDLINTAEYPGGSAEMYKFLYKHIKYPKRAKRAGLEGKVFVEFIIDKKGNVSSAKILKTFDQECADVALAAINKMPKWSPGEQFGKKVNVRFQIPVKFELLK